MKQITGDGVVFPRLRQHRVTLNGILQDSRISGNRRILGFFLALWLDAYEHPELQERLLKLTESIFGNASRTKWDDTDVPVPANPDAATQEATEQLKNMFDLALNGGSDAIPKL